MPQIMSSLSSLASSPITKGALDIAKIGSTGYNLYNQYKQQQYQNKLRDLASNPAKMSAYAEQFTKPLNAGLTANVANQAQAYLAQRGLTDSPQISEQVEAQALAPYVQQNQQQGYEDALAALGLGGGAIPPALQQKTGLDSLANIFSQIGGGGGTNGNADPNAALLNYLRTFGTEAPKIDPNQWNFGSEPTAPIDLSSYYTPDYAALAS